MGNREALKGCNQARVMMSLAFWKEDFGVSLKDALDGRSSW